MTWPLEGSRDVHDGIIISLVPDICLTPAGGAMVPIPYTIWCRQADAANLANSVRQTDDRSHALASVVLHCYGDEPGTGGGIDSGTTGADCTPKTWSHTVRAEGRNMVRHTDEWWMNHRNTYGQLLYTKDMNLYDTMAVEQINPQMRSPGSSGSTSLASRPQTSQLAQASYTPPSTPPGIEPPRGRPILGPTGDESPLDHGLPFGRPFSKYEFGARIAKQQLEKDCCIVSYYENASRLYLTDKQTGQKANVGGLGGCQDCKGVKNGVAAHHGIVDYTIRSGGRDNSSMRPYGAPSYWEALTVCIPGDQGHSDIHKSFDDNISTSADKKTGLSTWANAKKYSFQEIDNIPEKDLSSFCKEIYNKKLEQSYNFDDNMPVRASPNNPPDADPSGSQYQQLYNGWKR